MIIDLSAGVYSSLPTDMTDSEADSYSMRDASPALTDYYESGDSDLTHPLTSKTFKREPLTCCQILIINLPWFGLSLMYLILTIEGSRCYSVNVSLNPYIPEE